MPKQHDLATEVVADDDPNRRSTPTRWGAGERLAYCRGGTAPTREDSIRGVTAKRMNDAELSKEMLDALVAYIRSLPDPKKWLVATVASVGSLAAQEIKVGAKGPAFGHSEHRM
jgi:cytochrome c peroxidase